MTSDNFMMAIDLVLKGTGIIVIGLVFGFCVLWLIDKIWGIE